MKKFLSIFKFIVHVIVSIFSYDKDKPIEVKTQKVSLDSPLNTQKESSTERK